MLQTTFIVSPPCSVRVVLTAVAAFAWYSWGARGEETTATARFRTEVEPLLETYCGDCHLDGAKKGEVAFDGFQSLDELVGKQDLWQKVLKNLRAGLMPPEKKPRPSPDELQKIERWVKRDAFGIDLLNPDPGRVTLRRLNRVEYRNTVRDLMGVDFNSEVEFPPDDTGQGFDNIGEVLTVSPLLMEKYVQAAAAIVAQGVPTASKVLPEQALARAPQRGGGGGGGGGRGGEQTTMSLYEPATLARTFTAKHDGTYKVLVTLEVRGQFNFDPGRAKVSFTVDGAPRLQQEFGWQEGKSNEYAYDETWKAGDHQLALTLEPLVPVEKKVNSLDLRVVAVRVQGPMEQEHWGKPDNYDRFFPKGPAPEGAAARDTYARELLRDFATRAFRRPVEDAMADKLASLAKASYTRDGGTFEHGIARAMTAVLASPRFLYRLEAPGAKLADETFPLVDEYALASRLSYFFWSTMPDAELSGLAARGELRKNLASQVKRLLEDSRSQSLVRNFTGQWLQARDVESVPIDARVVQGRRGRGGGGPRIEFDSTMRRAMRNETEMFFSHILKENRSVIEMIDSNYTFLNEALAKHYGLGDLGVRGEEMRLVNLPADSPRGGFLTQGTILAVTSNPTRTSPVKRGLFILDNILGTPPPPPSANVPDLEVALKDLKDKQPSLREALELHRSKPLCSSCHNRMDPLGLALENFNALGEWRENEVLPPPPRDFRNFNRQQRPTTPEEPPKLGPKIDAAGTLVTGEQFTGVRELKQILKEKYRTEFYRCLTEKLLIYALGRGLDPYDTETVDRIVARLEREDGRFSALIEGIIGSAPFQKQRNLPASVGVKNQTGRLEPERSGDGRSQRDPTPPTPPTPLPAGVAANPADPVQKNTQP